MKKINLFFFALLMSGISFSVNAQEPEADEAIKPALLVIDVQKAFIGMMDQSDIDTPVEYINAYIGAFKQLGYPVIYVYHVDSRYSALGSEGYQFIDKIPVEKNEVIVNKTYGNAFNKTDLDKILKESGTNTLFLCGLSASGCVFATLVGGHDLDYKTYILKKAVMSQDKEVTKMIEEITEAINSTAMNLILNSLN